MESNILCAIIGVGGVIVGTIISAILNELAESARQKRELQEFNRRQKLEAYMQALLLMSEFMSAGEVYRQGGLNFNEWAKRFNENNVRTALFVSPEFGEIYAGLGKIVHTRNPEKDEVMKLYEIAKRDLKLK